MSIQAQFAGLCAECDDPIYVGDWIESGDEGGWVHANDCQPRAKRPRPICDRCWLQQPCGCEDET